jgi:hypothetical protein
MLKNDKSVQEVNGTQRGTVLPENCGKTELACVRCTGDVCPETQFSFFAFLKVETWDEHH